jgi:hypothetical protein
MWGPAVHSAGTASANGEWRMRSGSEWVTSSSRGLVGHFGSLTDAKIAAADHDEGFGVANAREQGIEGGWGVCGG